MVDLSAYNYIFYDFETTGQNPCFDQAVRFAAIETNPDFEIIDILGSGSIGQVYLIRNIETKKEYALKVIHPNIYKEYVIFNSAYTT